MNNDDNIQSDACDTGLGAVLMLKGQPVCYTSRALTDVENRYDQSEKELLAIVWSCHKLDQYIYDREIVHVESDHEPLQAVVKKPIYQSLKQLQRMCTALQNYSLDIQYKKSWLMFMADALSHAYRLTTEDAKHDSSEVLALWEVQHEYGLSVSPTQLYELKWVTEFDPEMHAATDSLVLYKRDGHCLKKIAPQSLYLTMTMEAN